MRTLDELKGRLKAYGDAEYLYDNKTGYIAWHYGTGENIEMLFVEVITPGKGLGKKLYRDLLGHLRKRNEKPYHSFYAFRLKSNEQAKHFYDSMGWTQVDLGQSVYGGDETVLMWTTWDDFATRLGVEQ